MKKINDENGQLQSLLDKIQVNVNKLYHMATHDEKTGLYNHVFFKDVFSLELDKAKRGKLLSLIIVDIDFFKQINDTHGHVQADRLLNKLARVLEKEIRLYDVLSRFGGEEFLIMLPNASIKKGKEIAERLRKAVLRDVLLAKYKVTVSSGVASYKLKDNFERISKRADKALYRAKKTGRNKVCVSE